MLLAALCVAAAAAPLALADNKVTPEQADARDYAAQCAQNGLQCWLVSPPGKPQAKADAVEPQVKLNPPPMPPVPAVAEPFFSGPVGVIVVLVGVVAVIGLWMGFGNGGVLVSEAPRKATEQRDERPQDWQTASLREEEKPTDFLQRVAAMTDRREAMILLLRQCLLDAAQRTGTRLLRSDTERAVFARLPDAMARRDDLGYLLSEAELVHYGGRDLTEADFSALLEKARGLISSAGTAHA